MKPLITAKRLKSLLPPDRGNRLYFDGAIPGFAARITAKGAVAFVLDYSIRGRQRRFTIGRHPILSISEARAEAVRLRGEILRGRDPLETRANEREAPTMIHLAHDYFEFYANKSKRESSLRNDHQMLDNVVLPKIGRLPVAAVTRRDLESLHASLRATPYRANRVLALLGKIFNLAMEWHTQNPVWRADNPATGIARFPEEKRERWLCKEELDRLTAALAEHSNREAVNAILLLLLTGSRKSEVLSATWSQFDLNRADWTKPSAHTKQKRMEHVPLGKVALRLLSEMKRHARGPYVFPGRTDGEPLKDLKNVWRELCRAAKLDGVRVHDLRHTYASHLVSSGVPLAVVGKLLGHTQSQTTERYAHLAESPLREATNRFGNVVTWQGGRGERP